MIQILKVINKNSYFWQYVMTQCGGMVTKVSRIIWMYHLSSIIIDLDQQLNISSWRRNPRRGWPRPGKWWTTLSRRTKWSTGSRPGSGSSPEPSSRRKTSSNLFSSLTKKLKRFNVISQILLGAIQIIRDRFLALYWSLSYIFLF